MKRHFMAIFAVLALLSMATLIFSQALPQVKASGSSMIYGCRDWGNTDTQKAVCTSMCQNIKSAFQSNAYFTSIGNNYGPYTTKDMVLQQANYNQQHYSWNTVFYVGHSAINQLPSPQTVTVYMNGHPNDPDLVDNQVYPNTGSGNHYFVFWWSCASANYIGSGSPSPWQLAYCWTHKDSSQLSSDGYNSPSGSACYIGFQYASPALDSVDPFAWANYGAFVSDFYYCAAQSHLSIKASLDASAQYITSNPYWTLRNLQLYQGYYYQGWFCYIKVFGNGNMVIPY
jgi:hypothetical protein